jgi:hypothetical protein
LVSVISKAITETFSILQKNVLRKHKHKWKLYRDDANNLKFITIFLLGMRSVTHNCWHKSSIVHTHHPFHPGGSSFVHHC